MGFEGEGVDELGTGAKEGTEGRGGEVCELESACERAKTEKRERNERRRLYPPVKDVCQVAFQPFETQIQEESAKERRKGKGRWVALTGRGRYSEGDLMRGTEAAAAY